MYNQQCVINIMQKKKKRANWSKFALAPEIGPIFQGSPLQLGVSPPNLNKPVIDVRVWRGLVFLCPTIPMLPRPSPPDQRSDSWEAWPGCVTSSRSPPPPSSLGPWNIIVFARLRLVIARETARYRRAETRLKNRQLRFKGRGRSRAGHFSIPICHCQVVSAELTCFERRGFFLSASPFQRQINLVERLEYIIALNYGRLAFVFIEEEKRIEKKLSINFLR